MRGVYRYAGPDGEGIARLPEGCGAAVGSEYCTHLLPAPERLAAAVAAAGARGVPLLLLSPYFRNRELKSFVGLLRAIPEGADVDVAVNDWGALHAARTLFPRLGLSVGRLLSGHGNCPRIGTSRRLTPEGRALLAEGLYSSGAAARYLEARYGVSGFHVDAPQGARRSAAGAVAEGSHLPPALCVHVPFAIVTVSDGCPWIGGRSSAAVPSCPRPCRNGTVLLEEPSMGGPMIQRGKARFAEGPCPGVGESAPEPGTARVVYDDVP